jgi:hypothetical protein
MLAAIFVGSELEGTSTIIFPIFAPMNRSPMAGVANKIVIKTMTG